MSVDNIITLTPRYHHQAMGVDLVVAFATIDVPDMKENRIAMDTGTMMSIAVPLATAVAIAITVAMTLIMSMSMSMSMPITMIIMMKKMSKTDSIIGVGLNHVVTSPTFNVNAETGSGDGIITRPPIDLDEKTAGINGVITCATIDFGFTAKTTKTV